MRLCKFSWAMRCSWYLQLGRINLLYLLNVNWPINVFYKPFYYLDSRSHAMFSFSYADILLINWWKFKLLMKSIRWLPFFFHFIPFLMFLCLTFDMPLMHWVVFLFNHPICSCVLLFEGFCNWGTTINCWVDNIWWSTWWSFFWVRA